MYSYTIAAIIMAQAARHAAKAGWMLEALERARRTGTWAVLTHAATKLSKYQPDQGTAWPRRSLHVYTH